MENKTDIEFTRCARITEVFSDSGAEYVLPDYNGDVRKILYTGAEVRPSGKFVGGDEIEFSGIVVYTMLYLDSENKLNSVEFTSDYDYSVKCNEETLRDAISDTRVSNYALRLVGPRKVSAKASVVGSVRLCEREELRVLGSSFCDSETPELNLRGVNIRECVASGQSEREYAETLARLDGAIAEEVSVLFTNAEAIPESVEYSDGSASIKGKLRLSAVVKNGDEPAYRVTKTMNIDESIGFEGDSDMKFVPSVTVTSLRADVNGDENGTSVVASAIVELSVVGEKNQSLTVVTDAYLKSCETENTYENFSFSELSGVGTAKITHNAEIPRSEIESERIREVLFLTATPKVESTAINGGVLTITGEIKYSGVASEITENDETSYAMLKFSSPFSINVNDGCQNADNLRYETKIYARGADANIDANNLYATSNLEVVATFYDDRSVRVLSSSEKVLDGEFSTDGAKITVYYPNKNDTLFDVARRYHTSVSKLASDNMLTEEVIKEVGSEGGLGAVKKLIVY